MSESKGLSERYKKALGEKLRGSEIGSDKKVKRTLKEEEVPRSLKGIA